MFFDFKSDIPEEDPECLSWELAGSNPTLADTVETQLLLRLEEEETQPFYRVTYLDKIEPSD